MEGVSASRMDVLRETLHDLLDQAMDAFIEAIDVDPKEEEDEESVSNLDEEDETPTARRRLNFKRGRDEDDDEDGIVLSDEPEDADLQGMKDFLKNFAEGTHDLDKSEWSRRHIAGPIEGIINNLGSATSNKVARDTYEQVVTASINNVPIVFKNTFAEQDTCCFCGLTKDCKTIMRIANKKWSIGSNCLRLCIAVTELFKEIVSLSNKMSARPSSKWLQDAHVSIMNLMDSVLEGNMTKRRGLK